MWCGVVQYSLASMQYCGAWWDIVECNEVCCDVAWCAMRHTIMPCHITFRYLYSLLNDMMWCMSLCHHNAKDPPFILVYETNLFTIAIRHSFSSSGRYVGSMVSDVHRTLLYGGVYLYPADKEKVRQDNLIFIPSLQAVVSACLCVCVFICLFLTVYSTLTALLSSAKQHQSHSALIRFD